MFFNRYFIFVIGVFGFEFDFGEHGFWSGNTGGVVVCGDDKGVATVFAGFDHDHGCGGFVDSRYVMLGIEDDGWIMMDIYPTDPKREKGGL